jgi:hypothetical protein
MHVPKQVNDWLIMIDCAGAKASICMCKNVPSQQEKNVTLMLFKVTSMSSMFGQSK